MNKAKAKRKGFVSKRHDAGIIWTRSKVVLTSDDSGEEAPAPLKPVEKNLNYYKTHLTQLGKRIQHFCETGEVLSDDDYQLPAVACKKKRTNKIKRKLSCGSKLKGTTHGKGSVGTCQSTCNNKPCSCFHKKPINTNTLNNDFYDITKLSPSKTNLCARKKVVSYVLSDSSDEDIETIKISGCDSSLGSVVFKEDYNLPSTSGVQAQRSTFCENIEANFEIEAASTKNISASAASNTQSTWSAPADNTDEDIDLLVNEILASNKAEGKGKVNKSAKDFLLSTQNLLSTTADLVNAVNDLPKLTGPGETYRKVPKKCHNLKTPRNPSDVIDLSEFVIEDASPSVELTSLLDDSVEIGDASNCQQPAKKKLGECPICLEPLGIKLLASTICGHIFCDPCIRNCIKDTKKCPNCRKRLNLKQIHPLYI